MTSMRSSIGFVNVISKKNKRIFHRFLAACLVCIVKFLPKCLAHRTGFELFYVIVRIPHPTNSTQFADPSASMPAKSTINSLKHELNLDRCSSRQPQAAAVRQTRFAKKVKYEKKIFFLVFTKPPPYIFHLERVESQSSDAVASF